MGRLLVLAAALFLVGCSNPDPEAAREEKFQRDLAAATEQARAHLSYFWDHQKAPMADEYDFLVKAKFPAEKPAEPEQLWLEVTDHDDKAVTGKLASQPQRQPGLKKGDEVTVKPADIVDWAFFQGESLLGHYTTRVTLPRMPADQAEAMASMLGENPK